MHDIIIIGAGCAGLTAAIYARRAGKSVLILESENIGGQISASHRVENYPGIPEISGMEFSDRLFSQATVLGADFELEKVTGIGREGRLMTVTTEESKRVCGCVIIATGVRHRRLPAAENFFGTGVSYCAVCDGAFYKGKTVAVAGGGSAALQSALLLSSTCEKVCLIHRRTSFRGEESLVKLVESTNNIELILGCEITALEGEGELESLQIKNSETGEITHLPVEALFVNIGKVPSNEIFADIVELDPAGYIAAGEDCVTSAQGVFAAGDCRSKGVRQLTTAAADGSASAIAAYNYLLTLN